MKKPREVDGAQRQRLEAERFVARLRERAKRKERNRLGLPRVPFGDFGNVPFASVGGGWNDFPVPKVLDLISAREATCSFFETVRVLIKSGHRLRLVFKDTERISSESLIYLLALMHRIRLSYGNDKITGTYPALPRVERLLSESGFFKILRVRSRPLAGRRGSVTRFVKCKSDTVMRSSCIPELRDELLGDDLAMPQQIGRMVFRALSEAMANVQHHAYHNKQLRWKSLRGRWWLGAQLSKKRKTFELTFYDAGVGIPKTLHRQYTWEHIRGVLALLPGFEPDDAQMIKAAVELGRSRTGQDNRGKGLLDIHQIITKVGAGALTIFSRCGRYRYEPNKESIENDENFIEGTLIKWELPLDLVVDSTELEESHHHDDA
ncbi:hypothetical protein AB4142_19370 [Variovorax sp. 2RAF20]